MEAEIDLIIELMKKYTNKVETKEIGEQETDSAAGSSTGSKNNVTTWSGTVGAQLKRGKANPLGNTKWESGLTRGPANQLT